MGARVASAMPLSSAAPCGRSLNVGLAHPPCLVGHAKAAAPAARAVAAKARLTAQKPASCCIQSLMRDGTITIRRSSGSGPVACTPLPGCKEQSFV